MFEDLIKFVGERAPDVSQFALLAWIIIRQQAMITRCEKWRDPPPE